MSDDVRNAKENTKSYKKRFVPTKEHHGSLLVNGEVGTEAEEEDALWDKGIMRGLNPPDCHDNEEYLSQVPYYYIYNR